MLQVVYILRCDHCGKLRVVNLDPGDEWALPDGWTEFQERRVGKETPDVYQFCCPEHKEEWLKS